MGAPGRLLITIPPSDHLNAEIARRLPGVGAEFAQGDAVGPWPAAEAMLTGNPLRELPGWTAAATPGLRFVQRVFTGLDGFPFDRFPDPVRIAGNGGGYAPYVAEHAVALLLAVTHNLPENVAQVRAGKLRPAPSNRYLVDGTALILGFGSIGREVGRRLRSLGMRIEGVSRSGSPDPDADRMHAPAGLLDGVRDAQVIVECRPLTAATRGTVDAALLEAMRGDAVLVNVGRAATMDEAALFHHLETHPEFRVATDVWWDENFAGGALGSRFPFPALPNFLGTPHVAAIGRAARDHAESCALENLARFFRGDPPRFVADRADYR